MNDAHPGKTWRILVCGFTASVLLFSLPAVSQTKDKMDKQLGSLDLGKDPHAFETAEKLYQTAETKPYDETAARLIAALNEYANAGTTLEDEQVWETLLALNPYRKANEVQAAVQGWADVFAKNAGGADAAPNAEAPPAEADLSAEETFKSANNDYIEKRFAQATAGYKKLLQSNPKHHDARNNLALTQIHGGNDLAALVELETLRKMNANFAPALVNLSVVYERLGQRLKALPAAQKAVKVASELPTTVYNLAWLESFDSNIDTAQKRLETIMTAGNAKAPYRKLYLFNKKVLVVSPPPKGAKEPKNPIPVTQPGAKTGFWRNGLAGVVGAKKAWWGYALAVVLFVVLSIILIIIIASAVTYSYNRGSKAFWAFVFWGGLLYILYWGIPRGDAVLLLAGYLIVAGSFSSSASKNI